MNLYINIWSWKFFVSPKFDFECDLVRFFPLSAIVEKKKYILLHCKCVGKHLQTTLLMRIIFIKVHNIWFRQTSITVIFDFSVTQFGPSIRQIFKKFSMIMLATHFPSEGMGRLEEQVIRHMIKKWLLHPAHGLVSCKFFAWKFLCLHCLSIDVGGCRTAVCRTNPVCHSQPSMSHFSPEMS